jgi:type I restriction enzyme, R subunit
LFFSLLLPDVHIENFAKLYFDRKIKQDKLHPILNKVVTRFDELSQERKEEFRYLLQSYIRLYAFLSQVIPFTDANLEKLYAFGRMLMIKLPIIEFILPTEIMEQVDMDSFRIQLISDKGIKIEENVGVLNPINDLGTKLSSKEIKEALSKIIEDINDRFGTDFNGSDKVIAQQLQIRIESDPSLVTSAKINSRNKVKLTFEHLFNDKLQEIIDEHFSC